LLTQYLPPSPSVMLTALSTLLPHIPHQVCAVHIIASCTFHGEHTGMSSLGNCLEESRKPWHLHTPGAPLCQWLLFVRVCVPYFLTCSVLVTFFVSSIFWRLEKRMLCEEREFAILIYLFSLADILLTSPKCHVHTNATYGILTLPIGIHFGVMRTRWW
jgi:hypothetical protein